MKKQFNRVVVVLIALMCGVANAQPIPSGLRFVSHGTEFTGTGTIPDPLELKPCSTNQVLMWNGSDWDCSPAAVPTGTGTVNRLTMWTGTNAIGNTTFPVDDSAATLTMGNDATNDSVSMVSNLSVSGSSDFARGTSVNGTAIFRGTAFNSHFNFPTTGSIEETFIRGGKSGSSVLVNDAHNGNVSIAAGGGLTGIGTTTPRGELSVVSANTGAGFTITTWDNKYSVFGPNAGSTTGAALAFGYSTTDTAANIVALQPGTAWRKLRIATGGLDYFTSNGVIAGGWSTSGVFSINAMTTGSVLFAGSGGAVTQDNANLFWDDTNNVLGIGTSSPQNGRRVHILANGATAPLLLETSASGGLASAVFSLTGTTQGGVGFGESAAAIAAIQDRVYLQSNTKNIVLAHGNNVSSLVSLFSQNSDGAIGIQNSAPGTSLDVGVVGGTATAVAWRGGSTAGVSAASTGRIRYNESSNKFQLSANTGAYTDFVISSSAGVGTTNVVSKWTAANTLGNSSITDTGSLVTINSSGVERAHVDAGGLTATTNATTTTVTPLVVSRTDAATNGDVTEIDLGQSSGQARFWTTTVNSGDLSGDLRIGTRWFNGVDYNNTDLLLDGGGLTIYRAVTSQRNVGTTFTSGNYNFRAIDTTSQAQGVGGSIEFEGAYNGTTLTLAGEIKAFKANSTAGNFDFDLGIATRPNGGGGVVERTRFKSTGEVRIGSSGYAFQNNSLLSIEGAVSVTSGGEAGNAAGGYKIDGNSTLYRATADGHLYLTNPYNTNPTGSYHIIIKPSSLGGQTQLYGGLNSTYGLAIGAAGNAYFKNDTSTLGAWTDAYFGSTGVGFGLSVSGWVSGDGTSTIFHNAYVPLASSGAITNLAPKWRSTHGTFGSRGISMSYLGAWDTINGTVNNSGGIGFYADTKATTQDATFTPSLRMLIANSGFVGVGTDNPGVLLDTKGAASALYSAAGAFITANADTFQATTIRKNVSFNSDTLTSSGNSCGAGTGPWDECEYGSTVTYTTSSQTSPRGITETVGQVTFSGVNADFRTGVTSTQTGISDVRQQTWTASVWMKASSGTPTPSFQIVRYSSNEPTTVNCPINTTTWTRCIVTATWSNTSYADNSYMSVIFYANTTNAIYLKDFQLERGAWATPYQANDATLATANSATDSAVWGRELRAGGTMQHPLFTVGVGGTTVGALNHTWCEVTTATGLANDYNPTCSNGVTYANSTAIRVTPSGGAISFTGLSGGVDGRQVTIWNTGVYEIDFYPENINSSAANRFNVVSTAAYQPIQSNGSITFTYRGGSVNRWEATALNTSQYYALFANNSMTVSSTWEALSATDQINNYGSFAGYWVANSTYASSPQNAVDPGSAMFLHIKTSVSTNGLQINGITGGRDGRWLRIHNDESATNKIYFANQNASASANDRIIGWQGQETQIPGGAFVDLVYDGGSVNRWRVVYASNGQVPTNCVNGRIPVWYGTTSDGGAWKCSYPNEYAPSTSEHLEWNEEWIADYSGTTIEYYDGDWKSGFVNSGPNATQVYDASNIRPGILSLNTGLGTNGSYAVFNRGVNVNFADGNYTSEYSVQWPTLSSTSNAVATMYHSFIGWADAPQAPVDGCYFAYDKGNQLAGNKNPTNLDRLECWCSSNSTRTGYLINSTGNSDNSFPLGDGTIAAATWYRLAIVMTGASKAEFYRNKVKVCEIATNIPSGSSRITYQQMSIYSYATTGTGDRQLYVDQTRLSIDLTNARSP